MPRSAVSEPRGSEPASAGGTNPSGKAPIRSEPTVRYCTAVPRLRSGSTSSTAQTQRSALSPGTRDSRTIPRTSKPVCFGKPTPCIRSFPERYIRSMALTPLETVSTITSPGFGFRTATSSVFRTEGSP